MCGIIGLIGDFNNQELLLEKMKNSLLHRGPDQEGSFFDKDNKVFLGHRRLNIIDLTDNARQPMTRNNATIVYNGEIYNYLEMKKLLENDFRFFSNSDTEVLLNGYLKWGIKGLVSRARGMFSLCIYDQYRKKIFLIRDRMGEKPLYFLSLKDKFAFSSELKSLKYLKEARDVDFRAVDLYFTLGYIPAPRSLIKNVFKLMPGHLLVFDLTLFKYTDEVYWDIDPTSKKISLPETEAKTKIYDLIGESVKNSLYSDVPLGVLLSGGLDSSAVTFFSRQNQNKIPKTFSVAYSDRSFDESKYSRLVANDLSTDHHEMKINVRDAIYAIKKLSKIMDEPLADMSFVPTYLLSKLTKRHVSVAVGGDGADELFCGYPTQIAHGLTKGYNGIPSYFRTNLIERLINCLPVSQRDFSFEFRLKRFVQSAGMPPLLRHFSWQAHVPLSERGELYRESYDSEKRLLQFFEEHVPSGIVSIFNLVEYLDLKYYLPNDILAKIDIASMANSLEVRSPFLNHKLVEFVYSLDKSFKFRWLRQKYILKKSMEGSLHKKVIYRGKHGFGIPLGRWLRESLYEYARRILSKENIDKMSFFNSRYIDGLLKDHASGRKDNRKQLWALIVFANWFKSYNNV